jgi:hypothetical protein
MGGERRQPAVQPGIESMQQHQLAGTGRNQRPRRKAMQEIARSPIVGVAAKCKISMIEQGYEDWQRRTLRPGQAAQAHMRCDGHRVGRRPHRTRPSRSRRSGRQPLYDAGDGGRVRALGRSLPLRGHLAVSRQRRPDPTAGPIKCAERSRHGTHQAIGRRLQPQTVLNGATPARVHTRSHRFLKQRQRVRLRDARR